MSSSDVVHCILGIKLRGRLLPKLLILWTQALRSLGNFCNSKILSISDVILVKADSMFRLLENLTTAVDLLVSRSRDGEVAIDKT